MKSIANNALRLSLFFLGLAVTGSLQSSEILHQSFHSSSLSRDYVYNIYLPDGYSESRLSYPVLYLLHGANGTEQSWVDAGAIQQTTDALIAAGSIKPLLIVIPADPNFWWADTHVEKARTAFVQDLMPEIEANFRTLAQRQGRAIAGYSAGGFGTTNLALNHPDLFAAAAALSPAVYTPVPPSTSSAIRQDIFLSAGEFDASLFESMNWVSFIDNYKQSNIVVPFYINTGDHDRFDIAYHAAVFYQQLREYQPEFVELRIFDGDHNFAAWGGSVGNAMQYLDQYLAEAR